MIQARLWQMTGAGFACLVVATVAHAQTPSAGSASVAVANPTYISIPMEIVVNRPAAEVWKRVGKYCDLTEWLGLDCTITSGKDGEVGAVRTIPSVGPEVIVARTELSYTYAMPVREGRPYNMYHGTLEARPLTPTTTRLVYTLVYDNSVLADDAARKADIDRRRTRFTEALQKMKSLAEAGTPASR